MIKYCPIMSFHKQYVDEVNCMEDICGLWDEGRNQCCLKTAALAVAGEKPGGTNGVSLQAEYVYPISTTPVVSPNSSGNPINPNPYTITCNLGEIMQ